MHDSIVSWRILQVAGSRPQIKAVLIYRSEKPTRIPAKATKTGVHPSELDLNVLTAAEDDEELPAEPVDEAPLAPPLPAVDTAKVGDNGDMLSVAGTVAAA